MADEHELLNCHLLQPAPDEQDLLSSEDDSMSCRLTGLTGNPAGFHSHQLQHSTRLLQLMTGGLRARQGTQAMIKARMLASSASDALAGRLRAIGAKEGGSRGYRGLGCLGNTQNRCCQGNQALSETCRLGSDKAKRHDFNCCHPY